MKIKLIAVGGKMPAWVSAGVEEYRRRLPRDFELTIVEIPLVHRGKSADLRRLIAKEGEACIQALEKDDYTVALDVLGSRISTEDLAGNISRIRDASRNLSLIIGGPDGLAPDCLQQADASWSLSALTLPHPLVRIVMAEQLYRAWSLLNNHPYHRQ